MGWRGISAETAEKFNLLPLVGGATDGHGDYAAHDDGGDGDDDADDADCCTSSIISIHNFSVRSSRSILAK